jgi:hypothetical protein
MLKLLTLVALSAGLALPAEFPLLSLIPDEAGSVVGFDVAKVLGSPFGRRILARMQSDDPRLKLLFKLGFDPARDLRNVVVSTGGGAIGRSLIAASGSFDSKKIVQGLAGELVSSSLKPSVYEGIEMMLGADGNGMAIPDNNTILLGHEMLIRSALDRRRLKTTRRSAATMQLLNKAEKWMGGYDLWFASSGPQNDFTGRVGERATGGVINAELLKGFDRTYGGLRFNDALEVGVETVAKSEKDAGTMVKAMKLLSVVSLMTKGSGTKNPLSFLDSLDIRADGNIVNLKIVVPKAAFDAMSPAVGGEQ